MVLPQWHWCGMKPVDSKWLPQVNTWKAVWHCMTYGVHTYDIHIACIAWRPHLYILSIRQSGLCIFTSYPGSEMQERPQKQHEFRFKMDPEESLKVPKCKSHHGWPAEPSSSNIQFANPHAADWIICVLGIRDDHWKSLNIFELSWCRPTLENLG